MDKITKLKKNIASYKFVHDYVKYAKTGELKQFDAEFYKQFKGKYFCGIPIYMWLQKFMASGECYMTSWILALAMEKDCYICRGDLQSQKYNWGKDKLGHSYVEKDEFIYDTTWEIICKKSAYEKLFKPVNVIRENAREFFNQNENLREWEIHTKEWFEENETEANLLISATKERAEKEIKKQGENSEQGKLWQKVLNDLPNITKTEKDNIKQKLKK